MSLHRRLSRRASPSHCCARNCVSALRTYYTLLSVGNISFRVSIDTASSDLWLFSSDCTSGACKSSPKYPLSYDSHSFVSVNGNSTTFNVSYADTSSAFYIRCVCVMLRSVLAQWPRGS